MSRDCGVVLPQHFTKPFQILASFQIWVKSETVVRHANGTHEGRTDRNMRGVIYLLREEPGEEAYDEAYRVK